MAEEEKTKEKKSGGFSMSKLLMLAGGAIFLVLATFFATKIMLTNMLGEPTVAPEEKPKKVKKEVKESAEIGPTYEIGKMVVNINKNGRIHFLKVKVVLEQDSDKLTEELDKRKFQIQDIIVTLLSSLDYDEMLNMFKPDSTGVTGKEKLQENLREKINDVLLTGKIVNVFFPEFVVQ